MPGYVCDHVMSSLGMNAGAATDLSVTTLKEMFSLDCMQQGDMDALDLTSTQIQGLSGNLWKWT